MKILNLKAENVKRLRVIEITPDGNIVQISGANASGKSSVLDSIQMALEGKSTIPSLPVRQGEFRAKIRLDLGEVIVTRSFKAGSDSVLTVESADGAKFPSPQRLLDDLIGSLAFDPLEFSRMPAKTQLEQLKGLVKLDVDLDDLDRQNAHDYQLRTEINRQAKSMGGRVHTLANRVGALDLPDEEIDIDELLSQIEGASKFNSEIERESSRRQVQRGTIAQSVEMARTKRQQAAMLIAEADELDRTSDAARLEYNALPQLDDSRDTSALRAKIDEARQINDRIRVRSEWKVATASLRAFEKESDDLTGAMERRNEQKQRAVGSAKMPIDGLGFGDGMVLYNDLPFDQASSAEQLRVSVAIAMAANPKLRVLRIKDGSLLDENSLRMIAEMATAEDYQVWAEFCDTTGNVGIVMEDGAVKKVNASVFPQTPVFPEISDEERVRRHNHNEREAAKVGL